LPLATGSLDTTWLSNSVKRGSTRGPSQVKG